MRYIDPRLSRLLAERMIAEAQALPKRERQRSERVSRGARERLGRWLIATGEKLVFIESGPAA